MEHVLVVRELPLTRKAGQLSLFVVVVVVVVLGSLI